MSWVVGRKFENKISAYRWVLLCSCLSFLAACAAPQRVDPNGPDVVTTVTKLDIQDAKDAAGVLSSSLLSSGILGQQGSPSTIANRIVVTGAQNTRPSTQAAALYYPVAEGAHTHRPPGGPEYTTNLNTPALRRQSTNSDLNLYSWTHPGVS